MLATKIITLALAIFLVGLFGQIHFLAQTKSNPRYSEPKRLMLAGDENADEEESRAILIREKFYPLGWSKDGKFAT